MSPLDLIPPQFRLEAEAALLVAALMAAAAAGGMVMHWKDGKALADLKAAQETERAALTKAVADQTARNLDLQRAAEKKYVVTQAAQEKFFVTTIKEIHDAAAPMASCPVPADVVRMLNDARDCALSDSSAQCGTDGRVPAPGQDAGLSHQQ